MTNTSSKAAYTKFLQSVDLFSMSLASCESSVDRKKFFDALENDVRSLVYDFSLEKLEDDHFDIKGRFVVEVRESVEGAQPHMKLEFVYVGHFHCDGEAAEDLVRRFADGEARVVFMPYVRELVTDLTAKMWIPPLVVPLAGRSISKKAKSKKKAVSAKH